MRKEFKATALLPTNADLVRDIKAPADFVKHFHPILQVIAEILDEAVKGEDSYLTLGLNRNRDTILMTLHTGGSKLYVGGEDLVALGSAILEELY